MGLNHFPRRQQRWPRPWRVRCLERLEPRTLLAAGIIELGPSDNIALDQPRVAVEFAADTDPGPGVQWESIGPGLFNTFLLDTGASSVLAMATAIADIEQSRLGYDVQGALLEQGVAGDHLLDVSVPYRFDFAGSSGIRHTIPDARIMSDANNDFSSFGPWGLAGMPAMVNRVTSLDFTGWSGGGLDLDSIYMDTEFRDDVPADAGHRYTISLDNRLAFDPVDQMVSGQPPIWGDVPFVTATPEHNGIAQEGNFLFDTGAQISVLSKRLALGIGLDSNGDGELDQNDDNYVTSQVVGGVGGQVSVPVFGFDEFHLPTDSGEDLVWTNLEWLVLDIATPDQTTSLDGVFGSDLLTSGWFHAFFSPGQPDGYINQLHMDFREMETNGTAKIHFDLNPDIDNVILPGPGIITRQSFRTTDVGEGGETDSYNIVLTGAPTADVTITLGNTDGQVIAENAADGSNTLVFTPDNWETVQTVLVTAVDDVAAEGNHTGLITHTVSSADSGYDNRTIPDVTVRVTDDDLNLLQITSDQAGLNLIRSVDAVEAGGTVYYWVALSEQPAGEMWVLVEDTKGQAEAVKADNPQLGLENVLMFNSGNWNTPQRVALTAVDDTLKEGPHQAKMVHTVLDVVNFSDPIIGQTPLTVNITDDDLAEVVISPSGGSTDISEAGTTDSYQIALNMVPSGSVEILLQADAQTRISSDGGLTFASTQLLSFTDTTPQTITVQAIDDAVVETTHTGIIRHTISGTVNDPRFSATLSIDTVLATITDNDTAGLTITSQSPPSSAFAAEGLAAAGLAADTSIDLSEAGDDATYWVVLNSQPQADVTVFLSNNDQQATAVDANNPLHAYLSFNSLNWNTPQAVLAKAVNDAAVEGLHTAQITHNTLSADTNYRGSVVLRVNITDDDLAGVTVTKTATHVSEDGSTTDSFAVALTAQPLSDVVFTVTISDPSEVAIDRTTLTFTPSNWSELQTINLSGVADGLIDGDQLSTIRINIDAQASYDPFDLLPEQLVDVTTLDVDQTPLDFGDAPTANQSGFANDYPVTLLQDGARHRTGPLFLGTSVDAEPDGQPDARAGQNDSGGDDNNGDADEDGVFVSTMVATAESATNSSLIIIASGSGKLDAWIDFNQDGDWNDDGEQVAVSIDVVTGRNLIGFTVPVGASVGDTAARFRISSAGGLTPTGEAFDGEVEDHLFTIVDGENSPDVSIEMFHDSVMLAVESGRIVVRSGAVELFAAPLDHVGSLTIEGTSRDEAVTIDVGGGFSIPGGGLKLRGAGGNNTLLISGHGGTFDLTNPLVMVNDFSNLDLSGADATTVTIDATVAARLAPTTRRLTVVGGQDDRIMFTDVDAWRLSDPITQDGEFLLTARNIAGGNESLEAGFAHPWQNFLRSGDVNNDGSVSASDALRIINELGRRQFSDQGTQSLQDPLSIANWPGVYFDHNGDDRATSLDALRVINDLARAGISGGSSEGEAIMAGLIEPLHREILQSSRTTDPTVPAIRQLRKDHPNIDLIGATAITTPSMQIRADEDPDIAQSTRAVDQLLADDSFVARLLIASE